MLVFENRGNRPLNGQHPPDPVAADGLIGINATAEFGLCNTNTTAYEVVDAVIKALQIATN